MKIILSIKPEYAEKILSGVKKFEFRKTIFSDPAVRSVLIYATKPVGKVVGEFEIDEVLRDKPQKIWQKTKQAAGIKKPFFDEYYKDRAVAFAISVGRVEKFAAPRELASFGLGITAPQSFCYLPSSPSSNEEAASQYS